MKSTVEVTETNFETEVLKSIGLILNITRQTTENDPSPASKGEKQE